MSIPPYDANTPLPTDTLADSQANFLNNFQQLYNAFEENHLPLDNSSGGIHTNVQLVQQSKPFQTDVSEFSVYGRDVSGQATQSFMRYQGNQTEFQYTNYQIYKPENQNWLTPYFTFLPGKILVYFGTFDPSKYPSGFGNPAITLYPYLAKNVIFTNICPIGTRTDIPNPLISVVKGNQGSENITALVFSPFITSVVRYQYIVAVNI